MFQPDVLVLGPGGLKGIEEVGSMQLFHEKGCFKNLTTIVGCSIGSVVALLYVCGYIPFEIYEISKNYKNIFDMVQKKLTVKDIIENKGIIDPLQIKNQLDEYVRRKYAKVPTLKELHDITGISFVTINTNMTTECYDYIDYIRYPDVECTLSAVIGINIPGIIGPVNFDGHLRLDGAMSNPYPINIFDDGRNQILGIFIKQFYDKSKFWKVSPTFYINLMIGCIRKIIMKSCSVKCFNLELEGEISDVAGIFISDEERRNLYEYGYHKAKKFLDEVLLEKKGSDS